MGLTCNNHNHLNLLICATPSITLVLLPPLMLTLQLQLLPTSSILHPTRSQLRPLPINQVPIHLLLQLLGPLLSCLPCLPLKISLLPHRLIPPIRNPLPSLPLSTDSFRRPITPHQIPLVTASMDPTSPTQPPVRIRQPFPQQPPLKPLINLGGLISSFHTPINTIPTQHPHLPDPLTRRHTINAGSNHRVNPAHHLHRPHLHHWRARRPDHPPPARLVAR